MLNYLKHHPELHNHMVDHNTHHMKFDFDVQKHEKHHRTELLLHTDFMANNSLINLYKVSFLEDLSLKDFFSYFYYENFAYITT